VFGPARSDRDRFHRGDGFDFRWGLRACDNRLIHSGVSLLPLPFGDLVCGLVSGINHCVMRGVLGLVALAEVHRNWERPEEASVAPKTESAVLSAAIKPAGSVLLGPNASRLDTSWSPRRNMLVVLAPRREAMPSHGDNLLLVLSESVGLPPDALRTRRLCPWWKSGGG
jgi:hypothetical protein